jgi:membrane protein DedA with SNARE-associated domain
MSFYENLISSGSLFIIFLLMISNGFLSFPSSQILYITLGVLISKGQLSLLDVAMIGALGNTIGNQLLFELTSKHGEKVARRYLPLSDDAFEALKETFAEKSLWWLGIGKLTPSLKVAVPILAGIAKTHRALTFFVFLVTSVVWAFAFLSLGIFFGKSFSFGLYGIILALIGIGVAVYFASLVQMKTKARLEQKRD